ncbi:MAG: hypothetical protein RBT69_06905, partial [Spirochaetia bacterium]|nr:hypothetical protein [Spirochaetia bacterium]
TNNVLRKQLESKNQTIKELQEKIDLLEKSLSIIPGSASESDGPDIPGRVISGANISEPSLTSRSLNPGQAAK